MANETATDQAAAEQNWTPNHPTLGLRVMLDGEVLGIKHRLLSARAGHPEARRGDVPLSWRGAYEVDVGALIVDRGRLVGEILRLRDDLKEARAKQPC